MGGGGGSKSAGESQSRTTPGFMSELGAVLAANLTGQTSYGKDNAIADVQGKIMQEATDTLQSEMPKVTKIGASQGAYGSTTQSLLANDLQARIMGQAAATTTDAIKDYAAIDADRIRAFAAATQAGTGSEMQSWESSSSRNGDSILDRAAQGVVGAGLQWAGDKLELADGGQVPRLGAPQTAEEKKLEQMVIQFGLEKQAQSMGIMEVPRKDVNKDSGLLHSPGTKKQSKVMVQNSNDDDNDLFELMANT